MNTIVKKVMMGCAVMGASLSQVNAKVSPKQTSVTVLNIDTHGLNIEPVTLGNLLRTELEKLDSFEVMDRYDVAYVIDKNKLSIANCYGKICLTEIGEIIQSDKMFSGSVELFGKSIVTTLRLIDVKSKSIEKTHVIEFLNLPDEIQSMMNIAVRSMFGKPNAPELLTKLTKKYDFDNELNNPNQDRLRLDGPRMGAVFYTGNTAHILNQEKNAGGYNAYPVMFQFGYQFEKQYLNAGKMQALFEFVPNITGLDQGLIIPSITLMNGLRSNVNGWELALGPNFSLIRKSTGYYDGENKWHLESEWSKNPANAGIPNPHEIKERMDSRGDASINTSFVVAIGRTFKSGKLNIPVNAFFIPAKNGARFGMSFGYNAKNKSTQ